MILKELEMHNKRIPFQQDFYRISPDKQPVTIHLKTNELLQGNLTGRLRIVIALDIREEKLVSVFIDGIYVGMFDIRFAYVNQIFEIPIELSSSFDSITLRQEKGAKPLYIYKGGEFAPCFIDNIVRTNSVEAFLTTLASPLSIQPFGWMEGCILDGLFSLGKKAAIDKHLSYFIKNDELVYENPRSKIADGTLYGIEGALPFAFIDKPEIITIFDKFISQYGEDELIADDDFISAEGCYTIAYPLAKRSLLDGKKWYAHRAVIQLETRKKLLRQGEDIYLRNIEGTLSYKNWGRAYVWYLLGIVQVFRTLGNLPNPILVDFKEVCEKVYYHLQGNNLCFTYIGEPKTGIETSTSAGIASVFHLGYLAGLLSKEYEQKSIQMRKEIESQYLTTDGLLFNVSQSNRNGEEFQRSGYRVISQMAMGLFAHCYA